MVKRFLALLVGASIAAGVARADEAKPAATPKPKVDSALIAKLVAQLASERFDERETAHKELDGIGATALDPLRASLAGQDEEARRRASHLIDRIQLRVESAQLTKPKIVRLSYTDVPVAQAVQDIARKTGFQIQIEGDQTKLAGRKITLDTGEVPFWQAIDQFTLKAGLVEKGSVALPDNSPEINDMRMERMRMRMWMVNDMGGYGVKPELPLVFLDGKAQTLPTCYAGALRLRVLPKAANAPGGQSGVPVNGPEGEAVLTVEVAPEPKMGLQNILSLRVDSMIEDKGAKLKSPLPYLRDSYEFDDDDQMNMRGMKGYGYNPQPSHLAKKVPLHLLGVKEVKKLKEIHGHITAEVLTAMQPLIAMEDILNSGGKSVEGEYGGSLKITDVKREEKGQVSIQVVVDKPAVNSNSNMNAMAWGRVRMWGGGIQPQVDPNEVATVSQSFSLVDDKGQAFKLTAVQSKIVDQDIGNIVEYTLTFQPPSGSPKPVKLAYIGRRLTTIEVPFALKDITLP